MFIVFNKQKIYSYLIALGTVVTLFVLAFTITPETIETSVNTETNIDAQNSMQNTIQNDVQNNN